MIKPPLRRVHWPNARRIISTRHPPIDLFEDLADPADWERLAALESRTNPRLAETIGRLDLVPVERRVSGPGASFLMAPFVHVSPDWAGRFHDGTFGALYIADQFATAVAETAYHRARFYRATQQAPGWLSQQLELVIGGDRRFHDVRGSQDHAACLDPDDYAPSQAFARQLRAAGSDGIVYPSVREPGGACVAAFWPDTVAPARRGRVLDYHFNGERVDLIRDTAERTVWRLRH